MLYPAWVTVLPVLVEVFTAVIVLQAVGSVKKANWPTLLPSRGTLSCRFTSSNVKKPLAIMDSGKLATLRRQLTAGNMIDRDRLELVAMFAPFALFTCKQASTPCPYVQQWVAVNKHSFSSAAGVQMNLAVQLSRHVCNTRLVAALPFCYLPSSQTLGCFCADRFSARHIL